MTFGRRCLWGIEGEEPRKRKAVTTHFLFSISMPSWIESISVISMKRQNNTMMNGGSRRQSSFLSVADPGRHPPPTLFLDQTEARRSKIFFEDRVPPPAPLSQGLDDRAPLNWRSGSANAYTNDSYSKSITENIRDICEKHRYRALKKGKLDLRFIISANKISGVRSFKKAMQNYKYKLNVGIPINLIHKKTKKQLRVNWSASSGVKSTRSGL